MAKFYGVVGYVETVETSPGVWTQQTKEVTYMGDVEKLSQKWVNDGEKVNDDLKVSSRISIVADPYAVDHFFAIKYVQWMGAKWKVTTAEPRLPRIYLTLGGLY